ncbi:MAG: hypothetical protein M3464_12455 [Chloroflexota bacterium]|nr:hypothetical protein [Chloroflexota bacterium]
MSTLDERAVHEEAVAATPVSPLTLDFLNWLGRDPRTYADAMEAWRTSCPRFTIWEDAIADGLIRLERGRGATLSGAKVVLTPRGNAVLHGAKSATRIR